MLQASHRPTLLITDQTSNTWVSASTPHPLSKLKQLHKALWIHVEAHELTSHPLAAWADSVSLDLSRALDLPQAMAVTFVRDSQYLYRACTGKMERQLRPRALVERVTEGYNSSEWSMELSKPARCVPLWFHLNVRGLKNIPSLGRV